MYSTVITFVTDHLLYTTLHLLLQPSTSYSLSTTCTCCSSHYTAPGNPPRHLRTLSSHGRSVTLLWYSPVSDALLGGPVTSYMVRLTSSSTGKTEERDVSQAIGQSSNSIMFTVGGLKPVTEYAISVAAVNAYGVGVFSSVVMATTKEAGQLSSMLLYDMHSISFPSEKTSGHTATV